MIEALLFVTHTPQNLPTSKQVGFDRAHRIWAHLVSTAQGFPLEVFVSPETQERETGIDARTIRNARKLFLEAGLMTFTGKLRARGAMVYRLHIEGFEPNTAEGGQRGGQTRGAEIGQPRGLGSGQGGGLARNEQNQTEQNQTEPRAQSSTAQLDATALDWLVGFCMKLDEDTCPIKTERLRNERKAKYRDIAARELAAHTPDVPLDRLAIVIVQENHPLRKENSVQGRTFLDGYRR